MNGDPGWHLDKRVPISIIIAMVLQTAAILVWATRLDYRVGTLELNNTVQDIRILKLEDFGPKIAVIEVRQFEVLRRIDIQTVTMQRILDIVAKLEKPLYDAGK